MGNTSKTPCAENKLCSRLPGLDLEYYSRINGRDLLMEKISQGALVLGLDKKVAGTTTKMGIINVPVESFHAILGNRERCRRCDDHAGG